MKRRVTLALFALALAGCATTTPYGNFVPQTLALDQSPLAAEATRQLAALWPPARTRLNLQQSTPDAFGTALVGRLRAAGYAVLEYGPATASAAGRAGQEAVPVEPEAPVGPEVTVESEAPPDPAGAGPSSPAALPLRYVLDHDAGSGLYRLTLWVGTQSLTRAYLEENHALVAAGYWVRRE